MSNKNPRGTNRPANGRGQGKGIPGGRRQGKNTKAPTIKGRPGFAQGKGQGKGTNRK